MYNTIKKNYKERIKNLFAKKVNYEELYNNKEQESLMWELKYNKLRTQLKDIVKESES